MKFQLKDVLPNPFRKMEYYPIFRLTVEHLKESIGSTEFWENIVGRKTKDGKFEIAYGHHRLVALKELFPETQEFDFRVKSLTDGDMLKIMARENMENYYQDVSAVMESVRATVKALGEGLISKDEMPEPDVKTKKALIRYAPSFVAGSGMSSEAGTHPYTTASLAKFLGMTKTGSRDSLQATDHLTMVLKALELHELGYLKDLLTFRGGFENLEYGVSQAEREQRIDLAEKAAAEARKKEDEELQKAKEKAEEERKARQAELEARKAEEKAKKEAEEARRAAARAEERAKQKADEEARAAAHRAKQEKEKAERKERDKEKERKEAEEASARAAELEAKQLEDTKKATARREELEKQRKAAEEEEEKKRATKREIVDCSEEIIRVIYGYILGAKEVEDVVKLKEQYGDSQEIVKESRVIVENGVKFYKGKSHVN